MKTIGLIGGMSWESTAVYYRLINEQVKAELGGLHSAKICLMSVDFHQVEAFQSNSDWFGAANLLVDAAKRIEAAGADFFLICTNTMHKVAQQVESQVSIPLLHIADATARTLLTNDVARVGLLGTAFTMEQAFYKDRLFENSIDVVVPGKVERQFVHDVIYKELCVGEINENSRVKFLAIIEQLVEQGAQAVILGCTEISLLVNQAHTQVSLYDTTEIHAIGAVKRALANS